MPTPRFDCHVHVYEQIRPSGTPRYVPTAPALRDDWLALLKQHDIHGGVIVQLSSFGIDNFELLQALTALGTERFRGIAVIGLDTSEDEMLALKARGITGVRWNLVEGTPRPDPAQQSVKDFLTRLNRTGLHLQIQLEGPVLATYLRELSPLVDRIVLDHFGLPAASLPKDEPWIATLSELAPSSDLWVKFSAPYRSAPEKQPYAETILEILGPERIVWGSDWPWTRHENKHSYTDTVTWGRDWLRGVDQASLDAANAELYGLKVPGT